MRSSVSTGTWLTSRMLTYPPVSTLQCFSNAWKTVGHERGTSTSGQQRKELSQIEKEGSAGQTLPTVVAVLGVTRQSESEEERFDSLRSVTKRQECQQQYVDGQVETLD